MKEEKNMDKHITTPITEKITADLKAGDYVYITGTIYVARDAAHKRMTEALDEGKELPFDIKDAAIYYMKIQQSAYSKNRYRSDHKRHSASSAKVC